MLVRVLRGDAIDPSPVRRWWTRLERAVASSVDGYLGATAGVADDGAFIAMVLSSGSMPRTAARAPGRMQPPGVSCAGSSAISSPRTPSAPTCGTGVAATRPDSSRSGMATAQIPSECATAT